MITKNANSEEILHPQSHYFLLHIWKRPLSVTLLPVTNGASKLDPQKLQRFPAEHNAWTHFPPPTLTLLLLIFLPLSSGSTSLPSKHTSNQAANKLSRAAAAGMFTQLKADLVERQQLCQSQRGSEGGCNRKVASLQVIEEDSLSCSLKPESSELVMQPCGCSAWRLIWNN